ncbi:unnamed protein product, partial [Iphiclides podalirius]
MSVQYVTPSHSKSPGEVREHEINELIALLEKWWTVLRGKRPDTEIEEEEASERRSPILKPIETINASV